MRTYQEIFDIAASRHGGADALENMLSRGKTDAEMAAIPEDRWLAQFTKGIFQAGVNWKVIENKWQGFEDAFHGFNPEACAFMHEEEFDALLSNTAVVRNGAKLATVRDNASLILSLREQGGVGQVFGAWPSGNYIGLLEKLKKDGARLGGTTGQYSLRFLGKDSFILSRDVVARLIAEGVIDKQPTSKGALKSIQEAFNIWMEQSGRGLTEISQTLARSL